MIGDPSRLFDGIDLALFDVDGTLVLEGRALPGAAELLTRLDARGVACGLVTNNTTYTPGATRARCIEAGLPAHAIRHVVNPLDELVDDLGARGHDRIFALANPDVLAFFESRGITSHADAPSALVVCRDTTLTYDKVAEACRLVATVGVPWFVSHPDPRYPQGGYSVPDAGLIRAMIEACTGVPPTEVYGKPRVTSVARVVAGRQGERVVVIGDRDDTDMELGRRLGARTIRILGTGAAKGEVDLAVTSVAALLPFLG